MELRNPCASLFIPDRLPEDEAFRRITHLGIVAHPDDLEIAAFHGIAQHFNDPSAWFGGIVVCDGGARLRATRRKEQQAAARLGRYAAVAMLDYPSSDARKRRNPALAAALAAILRQVRPQVVYTHSPADRHPTHVGVCRHALEALRALPRAHRPKKVYGCEVWGDLDWLPEADKVRLDVGKEWILARKLIRVFQSQLGRKNYINATIGRRHAHATFDDPHNPDRFGGVTLAMDLSPLLNARRLDLAAFVRPILDRFTRDVVGKLE